MTPAAELHVSSWKAVEEEAAAYTAPQRRGLASTSMAAARLGAVAGTLTWPLHMLAHMVRPFCGVPGPLHSRI